MKIIYDDITKVEADCIVNAANTQLQHGGGVALAISKAGGKRIQEESDLIGYCPIGKAVFTTAGDLPYQGIIHVPTVDWKTKVKAAPKDIFQGIVSALKIAQEKRMKRVAFPLLGAGYVGLSESEVKKQLRRAEKLFSEIEVVLCIKESKT